MDDRTSDREADREAPVTAWLAMYGSKGLQAVVRARRARHASEGATGAAGFLLILREQACAELEALEAMARERAARADETTQALRPTLDDWWSGTEQILAAKWIAVLRAMEPTTQESAERARANRAARRARNGSTSGSTN